MAGAASQEDRILTLHPQGKRGVNLARDKYDAIRAALLKAIPKSEAGVALKSLSSKISPRLPKRLFPEGKGVTWYVMTVKQDMEARGEIEQVPGARPQHLRRCD